MYLGELYRDMQTTDLKVNWKQHVPHEAVEGKLLEIIQGSTETAHQIHVIGNGLFYIHWSPADEIGLLAGLDLHDLQFLPTIGSLVWRVLAEIPQSSGDLSSLINSVEISPLKRVEDFEIAKTHRGLPGVDFELSTENQFNQAIVTLFILRPWSFLYLQSCYISGIHLYVKYDSAITSEADKLWLVEDKIIEGQSTIDKFLMGAVLQSIGKEDGHELFQMYLTILHSFVGRSSVLDQFLVLSSHVQQFVEMGGGDVFPLLSGYLISIRDEVKAEVAVDSLIHQIKVLYSLGAIEAAKLTAGTALELSTQLTSIEMKKSALQKLTEEFMKFGEDEVISLIRIIPDLFTNSPEERELVISLTKNLSEFLSRSSAGLEALVDAMIAVGKINDAIRFKFQLTEKIADKEKMAIEIFRSTSWMVKRERISQSTLSYVLDRYMPLALKYCPPGKTLQEEVYHLYREIRQRKLDGVLVKLTTILISNLDKVAILDRFDLLKIIQKHLESEDQLIELRRAIDGKLFEIAIEENMHSEAESLLNSLFSNLGVDPVDYHSNFVLTARRLILLCAKQNAIQFLNRILDSVLNVLQNEALIQEFGDVILEVLHESLRLLEERAETGLMLQLYKRTYEIHKAFLIDTGLVDLLNRALTFCVSHKDFEQYLGLSETRLKEALRLDESFGMYFERSCNTLISNNFPEMAIILKDQMMDLPLRDKHKSELYSAILNITEKVHPEFLSSEELYDFRKYLIEAGVYTSDQAIVYEQYSKGIENLLVSGMFRECVDFIVEAMEFAVLNNDNNYLSKYTQRLLVAFSLYSSNMLKGDVQTDYVVQTAWKVLRLIRDPVNLMEFVMLSLEALRTDLIASRLVLSGALALVKRPQTRTNEPLTRLIDDGIKQILRLIPTKRNDPLSLYKRYLTESELLHILADESLLIDMVVDVATSLRRSAFKEGRVTHSFLSSFGILAREWKYSENKNMEGYQKVILHMIRENLDVVSGFSGREEGLDMFVRKYTDAVLGNTDVLYEMVTDIQGVLVTRG